MSAMEIRIPDIGPDAMEVIEVNMKKGDKFAMDDTLLTLESDKATSDLPSPADGVIVEVRVKVGDKVKTDDVVAIIETEGTAGAGSDSGASAESQAASPAMLDKAADSKAVEAQSAPAPQASSPSASSSNSGATSEWIEVIPDIGNFTNVPVIEVQVKVGDEVKADDTLVVLESDKATMDVPATKDGKILEIFLKADDKVSMGTPIVKMAVGGGQASSTDAAGDAEAHQGKANILASDKSGAREELSQKAMERGVAATPVAGKGMHSEHKAVFGQTPGFQNDGDKAFAGPATRKLARELGVDLSFVKGTGRRGRIVADDVKAYVKTLMMNPACQPGVPSGQGSGGGIPGWDLPPWPQVDFAQFGEIERTPLSRIKKMSGKNLARNWVMIPHVTQCEDADMTDLEEFRKILNGEWAKEGIKASPLVFIIKAAVSALKAYPEVNASLDGEELVLKKYYHIGFAADTPNGLVVPVLKDADKKGLKEIAIDLARLSKKAREGKLLPGEMQGASFTISSLGGIGGTYFTPIVNAPEAAILGVCRSETRPVWNGEAFVPRLITPLSFSYDHRIIDGALACRFVVHLKKVLEDFRRSMI